MMIQKASSGMVHARSNTQWPMELLEKTPTVYICDWSQQVEGDKQSITTGPVPINAVRTFIARQLAEEQRAGVRPIPVSRSDGDGSRRVQTLSPFFMFI